MALILPLSITVGADVFALPRTFGPDGRRAQYEGFKADGTRSLTATISHTVPTTPGGPESHMFRCDLQNFDSNGLALRKSMCWFVWKTSGAAQNPGELYDLFEAMKTNLAATTNTNRNAIIAREL